MARNANYDFDDDRNRAGMSQSDRDWERSGDDARRRAEDRDSATGSRGRRSSYEDEYSQRAASDRDQDRGFARDDQQGEYGQRGMGGSDRSFDDDFRDTSYDQDRRGQGYGDERYGNARSGQSGYGQTGIGAQRGMGRGYRQGQGDSSSRYGQGSYGQSSREDYSGWGADRGRDSGRGVIDKVGDEVSSWFGDDDARRRREMDHRGKGPKGYTRSDDRIKEDVSDHLSDDPMVDASGIEVAVDKGEVTLTGEVESRQSKRHAEDCVDRVAGVKHVQNNLRVKASTGTSSGSSTGQSGTSGQSGSSTSSQSGSAGKTPGTRSATTP